MYTLFCVYEIKWDCLILYQKLQLIHKSANFEDFNLIKAIYDRLFALELIELDWIELSRLIGYITILNTSSFLG